MKTLADYPDLCAQLHPDSGPGPQPAAINLDRSKKLLWNFCDFGVEEHGSFNSNNGRRIFGHLSVIPLAG